jgi:hypothetical protein
MDTATTPGTEITAAYDRHLQQVRGELARRDTPRVDAPAMLRRVLEETGLLLTDYVAFPSRSAVIAVVTWIAQAACRDADGNPIWRAFVRLLLTSQLNGSGKSTLADFIRWLLGCRAGRASKITPYGLCKVLGKLKETAIADDCQNVFRNDKAGAELLTVLINGYTPGATWVSGKADGQIEDAAGPVVVVGKDDLMTKRREYLKDLIDRSVVVRMERPGRYMPEVDEDAESRARSLGVALKAVTGTLQAELRQAARDLAAENAGLENTDGDGGRTAQIWRPLLAVARVADTGTGTHRWENATRQAMGELSAATGDLVKAEETLGALEAASAALGASGRSFWDDNSDDGDPGPEAPPGLWRACCMVQDHPGQETPLQWLDGTWPDLEAAQAACEADADCPLDWETTPSGNVGATITTPEGIKTWAAKLAAGKD